MDPIVSAFLLLSAMFSAMIFGCIQGDCRHSDHMSKITHLNSNHTD